MNSCALVAAANLVAPDKFLYGIEHLGAELAFIIQGAEASTRAPQVGAVHTSHVHLAVPAGAQQP